MNNVLRILAIYFAAILCSFPAVAAESQNWKIGHVRPAGSAIDLDIRHFVETVTRQTDGALAFTVYPGNKLGDYSVVQERVSFGEVDMFVGPFGTAVDKRLALAFTPFLVDTWEQAHRLYSADSPLMARLSGFLENQNIKLIGGWPVYFGGIALKEKPELHGDPTVAKNMIIRVPPIKSFELTARALGYTPYPITWMYARMGLKTGMVKGLIGGGAEGYKGLADMVRYYLPVRDHFEYWFIYMNLDRWNNLPEKTKEVIVAAARSMEKDRYEHAESEEQENVEALHAAGIEILALSDTDRQAMRERVRELVWPQLRKDIGEPFDEVVRFVEDR